MSDTLVQVSAGDTKEDHPESLNVETAQPSLLKKGGLFGKSVAISPRRGDGSSSPVEKSSENGNEETEEVESPESPSKNGETPDANANGDHQNDGELDATNGDGEDDDDEVMAIDEPEEEAAAEEEKEKTAVEEDDDEEEEEERDPEEPDDAPTEGKKAEEEEKADESDDVEMVEDIEEDDEAKADEEEAQAKEEEAIAGDDDEKEEEEEEEVPEEKIEDTVEDADKEEEPKEDAAAAVAVEEEKKEDDDEKEEEEVEEECVKKVVSMDTDETVEEATEAKEDEEEEKAADVSALLDATQEEEKDEKEEEEAKKEEKIEEEEEKEVVAVSTPKRGRGRPPKSASSTPATAKKTSAAAAVAASDDVIDETEGVAATPPVKRLSSRGGAKTPATATPAPTSSQTRGRGRRSIKSDTSSQPDTADEEKKEEEGEKEEAGEQTEEEQEVKTPAARGRRSVKSTPATATRGTPRGKKAEKEEEDEVDDAEGKEVKEDEEEGAEPEAKTAPTSIRRGSRRSQPETPVVKETSSRASRSAKKEKDEEEEKEGDTSPSPSRRSTRVSPVKPAAQTTPKGRGRKSSVKSSEATEETAGEEEETEGGETEGEGEKGGEQKKGRGRGRKSVAAARYTPSQAPKKGRKSQEAAKEEEDPFDLDTELDKHPEPLRNITVERGSFGETKYTRSPAVSTSKYAATERSASDKVANLPNTPAATGTPKTIASVQSSRKSLGGSPVKQRATASAASRKKRQQQEEGEGEEEGDEEMDMDEEEGGGAMETPREKKGRGRPAGTPGRKRKADDTPAPSSAKRAAVSVTIPALDAEAQWAADHPEDDSAPFVPGARVFAVFQKVFYPALVGERDGLGRYLVEFVEDGIVRPVPPAGVVPLSAVTIDKECLYQATPESDPIECRVLRSANAANAAEWQAGTFRLMETGPSQAEHEAKWAMLQLDMGTKEWKKYVNEKSKMTTRINTDNITSLEDRRERRSRVHNDTAVAIATLVGTPEPSSRRSVTRKTPAAKATPKTPYSGARRGRKPKAAATPAADEEEKEKEEEEGENGEKMEEDEEEKMEIGDEKKPEINPRIFLNKTFILTSANRTVTEVQFKKNEMKKQIIERGGSVVEDINQVPLDAEAYLISDTHYRTHKYLAAMSRGMPCLSHMWLVECVQREELAPYDKHKLAGGQGLLDGELYPLPDVRGKLLVGRSILVHSKTDASQKRGTMGFKQIWSPIVSLLGATVVSDACLVDCPAIDKLVCPEDFEILLTDSSCPPEVVQKLESSGKAVVSSEWLIQSIIMGACPAFTAHPRFRYDSGNEPSQKKEGSQEKAQS